MLSCATNSVAQEPRDYAAEVAKAQEALAEQDYAAAYEEYVRVAKEKNNPLAQFTVGLFYDLGWGRERDRATACEWYARAAEGHIPAARHFLADCLRYGLHAEPDAEAAARWYRLAAENGHIISLCSLAELYIAGEGVARDPQKGLQLCEQAAQTGLTKAMVQMARFHLTDDSALNNEPRALYYLQQAAELRNVEAQFMLGGLYRDGTGVEADPAAARKWFEIAAARGYVPAYFQTGVLYYNAPVDPEVKMLHPDDLARAYMWLSAAEQSSRNDTEVRQARELLEEIAEVMPSTWRGDLDARVAEHLERHSSRENSLDRDPERENH